MLAFVALGCILCFLVSIPAFILAWIPPVRRLFSWLLRRRFLVLGCLVTLVALFYAVENWRGRRAWQSYKRAREAKGERFDLASFVPPPVPTDQNFFETPLWNDLRFVADKRQQRSGASTNWGNRVIFTVFGPKGNNAPSTGSWMKAQRVDLAAWQAFYRGSNNLFAAKSGPPTNYFPVAKEPQTPAADVLLALSKFDENRQLLIAAAARPQARFWINYDAGFAMLLPHLARLKASAQYLSLHANAALKAGDRETALEDVKLLFRLIESIRSEPILISHLVRIAMLAIALQPVWEGLADRQWTEAELRVIESELGKLDFLADYHFAMRGERACNVWGVDYIRKQGMIRAGGACPARNGKLRGLLTWRSHWAGHVPADPGWLVRPEQAFPLPPAREIPAAAGGGAGPARRSACRHPSSRTQLLATQAPAALRHALEDAAARPGPGCREVRPRPKPPLTSPASPARWSDTGWRTVSSRRRLRRSRRSSSRSCRTTSSTASRSSTAAPTTASLSSTRSVGTKPTTAARLD